VFNRGWEIVRANGNASNLLQIGRFHSPAGVGLCKSNAVEFLSRWLPPYSPELNPDELLNQDVKSNALGRVRPINVQEMMANVRSYLRIAQARPKLVKNYFRERHVVCRRLKSVIDLVLG
jgi:hypothetical protein